MKKSTKAWWLGMTILNTLALGVFFLGLLVKFPTVGVLFHIPHMIFWGSLAATIIASAIFLNKHWNNSELIVHRAAIISVGLLGVAYAIGALIYVSVPYYYWVRIFS